MIKINTESDALLLVDIQNDFLPGGALGVEQGDQILPTVNALQAKFNLILASQDFHPAEHESFAANHEGKSIGEVVSLEGLPQILWPVHCVQGSWGAEFSPELIRDRWTQIVKKGLNTKVDSYSAFFDNAKRGDTGLHTLLQEKGVKRLFVVGLALDYCVKFTVLDALDLGFETFLVREGTRAVNLKASDGEQALEEISLAGAKVISEESIK